MNEKKPRLRRALRIFTTFSLLSLGACTCSEPDELLEQVGASPGTPEGTAEPAPAAGPPMERDEAMEARASALIEGMSRGRFSRDDISHENGEVFVYIAGTRGADEAALVVRALSAMSSTHSGREMNNRRTVDDDYHTVILHHLGSANPEIQAAAMKASSPSINHAGLNLEIRDRLVALATNHPLPAGRYEALEALGNLHMQRRSEPAVVAPFMAALDAEEPWLVSASLNRLRYAGVRSSDLGDQVRTRALALLEHPDPGVRGRALDVIPATIGMGDGTRRAEVVAPVMARLEDPHHFVKSRACGALRSLRHVPAIHAMMPLIEDTTENRYNIEGWQRLDGTRGRLHHDGSAWSRTGDAAMRAIQGLSREAGDHFDLRIRRSEELPEAASTVRTWYERNQASIPRE